MDVRQEIAKQVDRLPPSAQEQVLKFAASLAPSRPVGEKGSALLRFASTLDIQSAREMTEAIEEECGRVDASEW
jgi:hypothetical protein